MTPFFGIDFGASGCRSVKVSDSNTEPMTAFPSFESCLEEIKRLVGSHKAKIVVGLPPGGAKRKLIQETVGKITDHECNFFEEPLAAAFAYVVQKKVQGKIIVCDFGAGHGAVSLVDAMPGALRLLDHQSDETLGGRDMDLILAEQFLEEIQENSEKNLKSDEAFIRIIFQEAENARRAIAHRGSYDIKIEDPKRGIKFHRAVSRFEINELLGDFNQRVGELCKKVIIKSDPLLDSFDAVIGAGGLVRMPAIQELIRSMFQKAPSLEVNPEFVIATGAALHCASLACKGKS